MMKSVLLAVGLILVATSLHSQTTSLEQVPPRKVIEQYLEMVEKGDLLTSEGWNRVSALFSAPNPEPKDNTIFVTTKHHSISERWIKGNQAEVQDGWWDPVGSFDSALRYIPSSQTRTEGNIGIYHLILTDKYWEHGADGSAKELTGPLQWKIDGPLTRRWTTVEAAIRYVTQMRDKSSNAVVKQNADKTVEVLQRHVKHN